MVGGGAVKGMDQAQRCLEGQGHRATWSVLVGAALPASPSSGSQWGGSLLPLTSEAGPELWPFQEAVLPSPP